MTQPRVTLSIANFGPIAEGTVEFKPLTFLIGANNSGKTYAATLLYALSRALRGGDMFPLVRSDRELTEAVFQFIDRGSAPGAGALLMSELPESLRASVVEHLNHWSSRAPRRIEEALVQYFSVSDVSGLSRVGRSHSTFLQVAAISPLTNDALLTITNAESPVRIAIDQPFPDAIDIPPEHVLAEMLAAPDLVSSAIAMYFWYTRAERYGFHHWQTYYLPAARSGILESWPLMASLAVRNVSSVLGRQRIDIPPLPGVVGDFLQTIIEQFIPTAGRNGQHTHQAAFRSVLDVLEDRLLGGRVVIDDRQPGPASITYESASLRLSIQRASSMIAELATVDLWVRELLEPGDRLIIDEPESHLHPDNQRLIARALVRLVNAGVDVVAPTHSSTILHQVSNMLIASTLDPASREELGYTDADLISPDNVAVYLFEQREDGTHIVPVTVEPGFGIAEDEFVQVAEALGDETFRLSFAASR